MNVATQTLAVALGIGGRAITKRAKAQNWPPPVERIRNGGNVYVLDELPLSPEEARRVRVYAALAAPTQATVNTQTVAAALGVTGSAIRRRAKAQNWPPPIGRVRNGGYTYSLAGLPLTQHEVATIAAYIKKRSSRPTAKSADLPFRAMPKNAIPPQCENELTTERHYFDRVWIALKDLLRAIGGRS
ncbi:hypothetical protein [Geoalkalibacter halelectricus]|uniref:hypothetical protein n=1 Tax=Geoalkalibacter halelectricus TaxID=2847045 RepID=UPI003D210E8B